MNYPPQLTGAPMVSSQLLKTKVTAVHAAISTGMLFDLAPQQIAACAPNPDQCGGQGNCNGATAEIAFDYVAKSAGLFEEF
jgi:hypothetical protein